MLGVGLAGCSAPAPARFASWEPLRAEIPASVSRAEALQRLRASYARDPAQFGKLTERVARNRAEIEAAELRWLEVAEMAEALSL